MVMTISKQQFINSEKGKLLREELVMMVNDSAYNTHTYQHGIESDEQRFVEKHMNYMSQFPAMDHWQYISNVKLMTKITQSM